MIILGIHDGHNAGVSLFKNGSLLSAISEEKYQEKNEYGFPVNSIKLVLANNNIKKIKLMPLLFLQKNLPPKYYLVKGIHHFL